MHFGGLVHLTLVLLPLIADGWGGAAAQLPTLQVQHLMRPQSVQALGAQKRANVQTRKGAIARLVVVAAEHTNNAASRLTEAVRNGAVDLGSRALAALGDCPALPPVRNPIPVP